LAYELTTKQTAGICNSFQIFTHTQTPLPNEYAYVHDMTYDNLVKTENERVVRQTDTHSREQYHVAPTSW